LAEVERETPLVPVYGLEKQATVVRFGPVHEKRSKSAGVVSAGRAVFDLDDLGAQIREMLGAERSRPVLLDREHAQAM